MAFNIGQGLSAAGFAAADHFGKLGLAEAQSSLEEQRAMRLAEFKTSLEEGAKVREEDRKREPLKRMQGLFNAVASEDVPVEPEPIKSLQGGLGVRTTDGGAPSTAGFKGDPAEVYRTIAALPDGPDKTAAMQQLRSQFTAEQMRNVEAAAGKTRKRSRDEVIEAATQRAMSSDLEALSAYETSIGKNLRDERKVAVDEKRATAAEKAAEAKERIELEREDRRDARAERAAIAAEERQRRNLEASEERQRKQLEAKEESDRKKAEAAANKLTDTQAKALLFGARMQAANETLDDLEKSGKVFSTIGAATPFGVGSAVNLANSKQGQMLDQAKRDFLNAVLRRESGAVISDAEFDNGAKQYFPQVGDKKEVIEQKRKNRILATRSILAEVPDAERRLSMLRGETAAQTEPRQGATLRGSGGAPKSGGVSGGWGIREVK